MSVDFTNTSLNLDEESVKILDEYARKYCGNKRSIAMRSILKGPVRDMLKNSRA